MAKFFKRTLQFFMLVVLLSAAYLTVGAFSEELATDIGHLECTPSDADGTTLTVDNLRKVYGDTIYAVLRKDWYNDRVILLWLDDKNTSENGLSGKRILKESTLEYSGYKYDNHTYLTINRESLALRIEYREWDTAAPQWFGELQCKTISADLFEKLRRKHASQTKSRQKI